MIIIISSKTTMPRTTERQQAAETLLDIYLATLLAESHVYPDSLSSSETDSDSESSSSESSEEDFSALSASDAVLTALQGCTCSITWLIECLFQSHVQICSCSSLIGRTIIPKSLDPILVSLQLALTFWLRPFRRILYLITNPTQNR